MQAVIRTHEVTLDVIGNSVNRHLDCLVAPSAEEGDLLLFYGMNFGGVLGTDAFSMTGPWTDVGGIADTDSGSVPIHHGLFYHIVTAGDSLLGTTVQMRIDSFGPGAATGCAILIVLEPVGGTFSGVTHDAGDDHKATATSTSLSGAFALGQADFSKAAAADEVIVRFMGGLFRNMTVGPVNTVGINYSTVADPHDLPGFGIGGAAKFNGTAETTVGVFATPGLAGNTSPLGPAPFQGLSGETYDTSGRAANTLVGTRTTSPRRSYLYDYIAVIEMLETPPEPRDDNPGFTKPNARRRLDISELPYQVTHMDVEDIFDA